MRAASGASVLASSVTNVSWGGTSSILTSSVGENHTQAIQAPCKRMSTRKSKVGSRGWSWNSFRGEVTARSREIREIRNALVRKALCCC